MEFKAIFITVVICLSLSIPLWSQVAKPRVQGIMLEAGGAAPFNSINYFRRLFSMERIDVYGRVGLGIWSRNLALPLGFYLAMGKNTHQGRLTLAAVPHSDSFRFWDREASDIMLDLALGLEYVYQFPNQHFLLSAGAFPYIRLDPAPGLTVEKSNFGLRPGISLAWIW
ncbi:MAG: hypothetical protein KDD15_18730 [Lewinella sp.]|nr:hypothetical protein [Lewinella sp.]